MTRPHPSDGAEERRIPDQLAGPPASRPPAPSEGRDPVGRDRHAVARRNRFSGLWIGLLAAVVVLVLLLIFVVQNSQSVQVDYFGFSGRLPLAVAILLGVAAGALIAALPGTVRILQLRKAARRTRTEQPPPS